MNLGIILKAALAFFFIHKRSWIKWEKFLFDFFLCRFESFLERIMDRNWLVEWMKNEFTEYNARHPIRLILRFNNSLRVSHTSFFIIHNFALSDLQLKKITLPTNLREYPALRQVEEHKTPFFRKSAAKIDYPSFLSLKDFFWRQPGAKSISEFFKILEDK